MDENPYEVLGLNASASAAQIKRAYRKLALKHHPDKQSTEEAKREAHTKFSKISHAYEILGDESRRREYDLQLEQERQYAGGSNSSASHHGFSAADYQFHDPFAVFEQVFAQEFGTAAPRHSSSFGGGGGGMMGDPFAGFGMGFGNVFGRDPFAQNGFGSFGGGGGFGGDPYQQQQRQRQQQQHYDPFFQMQQQMEEMRRSQMDLMRASQQGGGFGHGGGGGFQSFSSYSSSSSSTFGGSGGQRESVSTTTRIVNGKRQTVTERVVTKPDGTVERHVETSGDDDFPDQQRLTDGEQRQGRRRRRLENGTQSSSRNDNERGSNGW